MSMVLKILEDAIASQKIESKQFYSSPRQNTPKFSIVTHRRFFEIYSKAEKEDKETMIAIL